MRNTRLGRASRLFRWPLMCVLLAFSGGASGATEAKNNGETAIASIVVGAPERIEVWPQRIKLDAPRREMHLIVSGFYGPETWQDLTQVAAFTSSDPGVVRIEGGIARPVADGQAEITVAVGGQQLVLPVEVCGQQTVEPVSFQYGTLVALTKQGCNQGACHGSPSGKGGFRLSLRAYDAAFDSETLIREAVGRRTNLLEPQESLLLQKPLMEVSHGGGRRLSKTDANYVLLRDWIAQGCRLDPSDAPQCVKIEVFPRQRVLHRPAHVQQLLVLAHFSDGTLRDVTRQAVFSSSNDAVATVDDNGLVVGVERGEAAILARYLEHVETCSLTFLWDVSGFSWPNPPENNYVDQFVFEKLRQMQIVPSELCADEEFVRRVFLDVIGTLPTIEETQAFLASTNPGKRRELVAGLLERPEYAEFWALKWADVLRLRNGRMTVAGVHKFHSWLVRAVRSNMPYDQFARTLLTADGSTFSNPPASYYRAAADTNDCTEMTSQLFLGIRIQCAKCHNHPFERWTQDNYYGIGAFFQRVQRKKVGAQEVVVWSAREGEIVQPRTGKQLKPWLPLKGDVDLPTEDDRRSAFVAWLATPENPFFARTGVNRMWSHLLGRGIVEPVDDFRDSNPPSSAALLDALEHDFADHGFDCKKMIRTITDSRTYQLSSRKHELNKDDLVYFSHSRTRLLPAEQLLDALCRVTGVDEKYAGLPAGMRAIELPSPDVDSSFLRTFGRPARETACQCERPVDSNFAQALQMVNGPLVQSKVTDPQSRMRQAAAAGKSDEEIIRELYLAALCRTPDEPEIAAAQEHVRASDDRMRGLEDVCWALLNANEFLFQH
jgi:Protein of unknown function (DUF1553)/Protein of unknown function (DUF1549)